MIFHLLANAGTVLDFLMFSSGQHTCFFGLPLISCLQTNESLIYFPMSAEIGFRKFFIKALSWSQFSWGTQIDLFPLGAVHGVGILDCSGLNGSPKSNWNGWHDTFDNKIHSQRINKNEALFQQACSNIWNFTIFKTCTN